MTCTYHQARLAAQLIAPANASAPEKQRLITRIMDATNTGNTADFGEEITLNVGVRVTSYDPGRPMRMPTPNNPGDPEEPEEIEIAVLNEDGEEISSLLPEDVFEELLVSASEYMRDGGRDDY